MRLISDFGERFWRRKILENFCGEENFDFAKIQDRMYEKHESYGVLKLSKQALQKGTVLNCAPLYSENDWNWSAQLEKGSEQFETISNKSETRKIFSAYHYGFPLGNLLTEHRKAKNRKI